jgi:Kef-type K+ transport system membrane component KefB
VNVSGKGSVAATTHLLFDLLIVFAAARLAGELFERLHLPAVVGEILAGVIVGPSVLGLAHESAGLVTVATLGVVVLQFSVGLETRPSQFLKVGWVAAAVALLGVALSLGGGFAFGRAIGLSAVTSLFVGTAIVSTSVGVSARVLKDMGLLRRASSRLVIAAAVIDDVLGPLILAVVVSLSGGHADMLKVLAILGAIGAFLVFEIWFAPGLIQRHAHLVEHLSTPNAPFIIAVAIMLLTAAVAEQIGLAAVVGAFLAGMMLAETEDRYCISRDSRPLYDWLVPYFFAVTGMRVQLSLFADPRVLALGIGLTAVAVAAKLVGCGAGAMSLGWRRALAVGVGMIPRAEIGLIVASVGLSTKVLDARTYDVIMFAIIATVVIAPLLIPLAYGRSRQEARA